MKVSLTESLVKWNLHSLRVWISLFLFSFSDLPAPYTLTWASWSGSGPTLLCCLFPSWEINPKLPHFSYSGCRECHFFCFCFLSAGVLQCTFLLSQPESSLLFAVGSKHSCQEETTLLRLQLPSMWNVELIWRFYWSFTNVRGLPLAYISQLKRP